MRALSTSLNIDDTTKINELLDQLRVQKYPSFKEDDQPANILEDIGAELKRRQIVDHTFQGTLRRDSESTIESVDSILDINRELARAIAQLQPNLPKTPPNLVEVQQPSSPRKQLTYDRRVVQKTPEKGDLPSVVLKTPTKKKKAPPTTVENLAGEIEKLGIDWGGSAIRRTQAANELATSSSGQEDEEDLIRQCIAGLDVVKPKKPLSLRQFFNKELQPKSPDSTLTTADNNSLASQFLKSLLNMSSSSSSNSLNNKNEQSKLKRTSTPLHGGGKSVDSLRPKSSSNNSSKDLFSSESRISSVHGSSSEERKQLNKVTLLPPKVTEAERFVSTSPSSSSKS